MFGLMKACSCNKSSEEKELQRLHYCGTCKTMGRLYGQKARLFLNYDAVFLGEVLTALQPSQPQFASAYISKNCLSLPRREQIPLALEYAAAVNVVLAQFKLRDHLADSGSRLIDLASRCYSQEFKRASETLARCRFPFQELERILARQVEREREPQPRIERLAEPTASATGLVFEHGAMTIDAPQSVRSALANLGSAFGEIAYLVDAMKDKREDAAKGTFNALTATRTSTRRARLRLGEKRSEVLHSLHALPMDDGRKQNFAARLDTNLAPYLFMRRSRRGPDQVVIIRENRGPGCCGSCMDAICCCEAINCCDCLGNACCCASACGQPCVLG